MLRNVNVRRENLGVKNSFPDNQNMLDERAVWRGCVRQAVGRKR